MPHLTNSGGFLSRFYHPIVQKLKFVGKQQHNTIDFINVYCDFSFALMRINKVYNMQFQKRLREDDF